jgi:alpha-N-arabinofuranosidase
MADVLVVGGMLLSMLEHADRLKIGCIAQIVNVIAPIMTVPGGGAWRQSTYWPLMHASVYGRGTALRAVVDAPLYDAKSRERVPTIKQQAVLSEDGSELTLFVINREPSGEQCELTLDLRSFGKLSPLSHTVIANPDMNAVNSLEIPNNVAPSDVTLGQPDAGKLNITLAGRSWNVIRFKVG